MPVVMRFLGYHHTISSSRIGRPATLKGLPEHALLFLYVKGVERCNYKRIGFWALHLDCAVGTLQCVVHVFAILSVSHTQFDSVKLISRTEQSQRHPPCAFPHESSQAPRYHRLFSSVLQGCTLQRCVFFLAPSASKSPPANPPGAGLTQDARGLYNYRSRSIARGATNGSKLLQGGDRALKSRNDLVSDSS
jgi:hypothetical protein